MNRLAPAVLGVDIGTSSSKGVLVDLDGRVLRSSQRNHTVDAPRPGWFEMDAQAWWHEFVDLSRELVAGAPAPPIAVGVSGMGPCVLLTDENDVPVRPAILYGVDMRAGREIARLSEQLGSRQVLERCGSGLTSQAAGAKIAWVADAEPDRFARARRFYNPSSWLVRHLTGAYVLDHHTASQCVPMYDVHTHDWYRPWADPIVGRVRLPPLQWPGDIAGRTTASAAEQTGLPPGIPVITGTVDAWAEAISVDAHRVGDLMLMYGTTMFLVHTVERPVIDPSLWGPVGALPGTRSLAGGMATAGSITTWLRDLVGAPDFPVLLGEADRSGVGANGLLMLPYFAGERTPIMDPDARGVIAGLTLSHTRGDLFRAALEAIALGVRDNVETMVAAGGDIRRVVAVGGGTRGGLWPQIVSDVTGRDQIIPSQTIGASYGGALLAAQAVADVDIRQWNPPERICRPREGTSAAYDRLYGLYRQLYVASREVLHALAHSPDRPDRGPSTTGIDQGGPR
ncbi:MAG: FGGY-family carbohydrate kinase [Intrasporangium sp.]|uniref:FGGY-family carbohydrate kinase n=1 Tax=Intrasporangium sp. TaxID=1925024 RepID=UPI003F7DDAC4